MATSFGRPGPATTRRRGLRPLRRARSAIASERMPAGWNSDSASFPNPRSKFTPVITRNDTQGPHPMATEAQTNANRENAEKSPGPRTPQGKAISSRNSLVHGMTSGKFLPPDGDPDEFFQLLAQFRGRFQPFDEAEDALVERLVAAEFKMRSVRYADAALFHIQAAEDPMLERYKQEGRTKNAETEPSEPETPPATPKTEKTKRTQFPGSSGVPNGGGTPHQPQNPPRTPFPAAAEVSQRDNVTPKSPPNSHSTHSPHPNCVQWGRPSACGGLSGRPDRLSITYGGFLTVRGSSRTRFFLRAPPKVVGFSPEALS